MSIPLEHIQYINYGEEKRQKNNGKWSPLEHQKFLQAVILFQHNWRKISQYIGSRTSMQVRSHAQKYYDKKNRQQDRRRNGMIIGNYNEITTRSINSKRKHYNQYYDEQSIRQPIFIKQQPISQDRKQEIFQSINVKEEEQQFKVQSLLASCNILQLYNIAFRHQSDEQNYVSYFSSPKYTPQLGSISTIQSPISQPLPDARRQVNQVINIFNITM